MSRKAVEPGSGRAPTSADVARLAGVSRSTVSLVLNDVPDSRIPDATQKRVLAAVRELGYAPNAQARQLRAGSSRLVIMPLPRLPLGHTSDTMIEALSERLQQVGLTLLLHGDRNASGIAAARMWAELRPAAVVVSADRCTKASVALLRRAGVQLVLIAEEQSPLAHTLVFDQRGIGTEAARHLLAAGHRHLAALIPTGPLEQLGRSRSAGLREATLAAGADSEEILLEATPESAERAAKSILRPGGPTAVFTYNDEYGALMHGVLTDLGVTFPDDLALVGADDLPIARYLRPTLSSVAIDALGMADKLFAHVQALLNGPAGGAGALEGLAPPQFVHRATS